MKKSALFASTLLLAFTSLLARNVWSAPQNFDGFVSDSMCGKSHMMPGKSDAQCIQECIKAGSKYVLVSGNKVYTLSASAQTLASFAGKHVQVQGELHDSTLNVQSIHANTK